MPRKVTVATTSWNRRSATRAGENLDSAGELLATAGANGADLCVLPEGFNTIGLPEDDWPECAEPGIPGPVSERLAEAARRHGMYVVAGIYHRRDSAIRNSALVLDRQGNEAWRYEKIRPTLDEM